MTIAGGSLKTLALLVTLSALAACRTPDGGPLPRFSYEGETGPEHWGDLHPDWILAKTGQSQSPIDLRGASRATAPRLEPEYHPTPLRIQNTGHTIQLEYAPGSDVMASGERYHLVQLSFHSPSEHTLDGRHTAMEVQMLHREIDGDLGVIAVLIEAGAENEFLAEFWDFLPAEPGPAETHADVQVNAAGLFPSDNTNYRYTGSLTAPPCTEGVAWFVLETPIEASQQQIDAFRQILHGNNRPLQPLNGRRILRVDHIAY